MCCNVDSRECDGTMADVGNGSGRKHLDPYEVKQGHLDKLVVSQV